MTQSGLRKQRDSLLWLASHVEDTPLHLVLGTSDSKMFSLGVPENGGSYCKNAPGNSKGIRTEK
jgi:hypothetical protein